MGGTEYKIILRASSVLVVLRIVGGSWVKEGWERGI